jgi:hypothetical protein
MFWESMTPDQWSALGTVVSAVIAVLNLVVVIVLLVFTKEATASARAQAALAVRTLFELDLEKKLQKGRDTLRTQGRLKDLGDMLLVLEQALQNVHFAPNEWKGKPADWHEMADAVIQVWMDGIPKVTELEQRLRAIDIRLRRLAGAPMSNADFHRERADLKDSVHETEALVAEVWKGLMNAAT